MKKINVNKRGFTLVEIMIVVAIILILSAAAFTGVDSSVFTVTPVSNTADAAAASVAAGGSQAERQNLRRGAYRPQDGRR